MHAKGRAVPQNQFPDPSQSLQRRTLRELEPMTGSTSFIGCPPELSPSLFGGIDGSGVPDTFVLLDAGRVPFLSERLEQAGRTGLCLFQGEAEAETGDVAPWLVDLREDDRLLRDLMTKDDADPWALWDRQAGTFIRSNADIATLRQHLRRFTRQRDRRGAWHYVRFYDPAVIGPYLISMTDEKRRIFMGPMLRVLGITGTIATMIEVAPEEDA